MVSGRVSPARNVLLNLDKQYPNEIFSVFIKKEDLVNFGNDPVSFLKRKRIAVTCKVGDLGGKPVMYIGKGKDLEVVKYRFNRNIQSLSLLHFYKFVFKVPAAQYLSLYGVFKRY